MIIQEIVDLDIRFDVVDEDEEIVSIDYIGDGVILFATKRAMYAMHDGTKASTTKLRSLWPNTFDWMEIPEDDGENGEEQTLDQNGN